MSPGHVNVGVPAAGGGVGADGFEHETIVVNANSDTMDRRRV